MEVIGRGQIRDAIPEAVVLGAIKGNTEDIRNIGLKAGADIVIVGTAISKLKKNKQNGHKNGSSKYQCQGCFLSSTLP